MYIAAIQFWGPGWADPPAKEQAEKASPSQGADARALCAVSYGGMTWFQSDPRL